MMQLLKNKTINSKQAKVILEQIYLTKKSPKILIKELGFEQITDPKVINEFLRGYFLNNQNLLQQYHERPERVEKFFIGQLMKDTKGQANPIVANEQLQLLLKEFIK